MNLYILTQQLSSKKMYRRVRIKFTYKIMNISIKEFFKEQNVKGATVLAIGLVVAAGVGAWTVLKVRSYSNTLSVTGSAKVAVVSDSVKWASTITRTVTEEGLQGGYIVLAKDLQAVQIFLTKSGIAQNEITISPVFSNLNYKQNDSAPREYTLNQTITVDSKDLAKIDQIVKNTQQIVQSGVIFSTNAPEYYYSKLSEQRVALLANAIKDAKARADQLAKTTGKQVGSLQSASSGVVQVLSKNSIDVSDSGQYDTSSIDKDVMITVKATFVVK